MNKGLVEAKGYFNLFNSVFKTSISKTTIATLQSLSNNKVLPLIRQTKATFQLSKNETRLTQIEKLSTENNFDRAVYFATLFLLPKVWFRDGDSLAAQCVCVMLVRKKNSKPTW